MLAISVEFLFGTFRADPLGTAHTGGLEEGEWPPFPSRLLSALVAADGTDVASEDRYRRTTGSELRVLERLGPPKIYADAEPCHQVLNHRYIVGASIAKAQHHQYVARGGVLVRPGVRVSMRQRKVCFLWNAQIDPDTIIALQYRAARVGYLGCSDSPVRVRVADVLPDEFRGQNPYRPNSAGGIEIGVPSSGHVQSLDAMYSDWMNRGANVSRYQYRTLERRVRYTSPLHPILPDRGKVVVWLRLKTPLPGRHVSEISARFKDAVLSQFNRIYGEPPAILHGHGFKKSGYNLARFLALPDVGSANSRGRIHGLALWVPPGVEPEAARKIADATKSVRRLVGKGIDVLVAVRSDSSDSRYGHYVGGPWVANPRRWIKRSRQWVTAIPAIHERYGHLSLDEIARWCVHAGYPKPVSYRSSRLSLISGGLRLAPTEVPRPGRAVKPYSHLELYFTEPVMGPVVIGAGRQRGFGLCAPVDEASSDGSQPDIPQSNISLSDISRSNSQPSKRYTTTNNQIYNRSGRL